ncbi:helix-turn-helix domain-containing protein [Curtobacterium sp. ISL-83]|uniref:AraC family transcriptional regulator n=1 Tax=Curtobacterium sp. ISL-83 TaxID=2819145 RepID=UPI001BEAE771|nr:helix-turn-helix domain-containing protein [Curtobacterium sp. ISL-83]MBT2502206.1 AraC family transcriptional regulator [Curtobacterium sp. ISL-83]
MTDKHPEHIRESAHGEDLDEARAVLSTAYDGIEWHADATAAPFSFGYSSVGDANMTLRSVHFDGRISGVMTPSDDFVVQWITRGAAVLGERDDRIDLRLGVPQLWPQQGAAFTFEDYDQQLVQVNRSAVEEVAKERGFAADHLRLDHLVTPDERSLLMWKNTLHLISQTVLDRNAPPLLQAEMSRLGALTLLELYPVAADVLPAELLLPRNDHIRRAVEYVHAHAHLPITSTDLAEIASLSLRALQQAFQRQFGMTPNTYLRTVRLDRVRDALHMGDPGTTSIADVARTWGFAHAGRFSAAYLEQHGEYPKETLRRV